jgi:hypothetical protein
MIRARRKSCRSRGRGISIHDQVVDNLELGIKPERKLWTDYFGEFYFRRIPFRWCVFWSNENSHCCAFNVNKSSQL